MAKYLLFWELDSTKVLVNPKERNGIWKSLVDMVKQDMEKSLIIDWGCFIGELCGYSVIEGNEIEIENMIQRYIPYVHFKLHSIASIQQIDFLVNEQFRSILNY